MQIETIKLFLDNGFAILASVSLFVVLVWIIKKQNFLVEQQRRESQENIKQMAEISIQFAKSIDGITDEFHNYIQKSLTNSETILENTNTIKQTTNLIFDELKMTRELIKAKKNIK